MPLSVLSGNDVKSLLDSLSLTDVDTLQKSLRQALREFSTATQDNTTHDQAYTHLFIGNGTTTLFIPLLNSLNIGMKVITASVHTTTTSTAPARTTAPCGVLTLMSNSGQPRAFLNTKDLTAFRTALVSSLLITRRARLSTLTVFGAGTQAYWHIRLSLLLHGNMIKQINIINRCFSDAARCVWSSFHSIDPRTKEKEGWGNTKFSIVTPSYCDFARLKREQILAADVIFCTTPSTQPLFDGEILTSNEGRQKGRLIIAIGSYKPNMIEVPTDLLIQAVKPEEKGHHFHKHAKEGGVIVVDDLGACLRAAGEVVQAGLNFQQLVEVGELVMLDRLGSVTEPEHLINPTSGRDLENARLDYTNRGNSRAIQFREDSMESHGSHASSKPERCASRCSSNHGKMESPKDDAMCQWLRGGNVIYKSVGIGSLDLVVGRELVRLASEKGVGINIEQF